MPSRRPLHTRLRTLVFMGLNQIISHVHNHLVPTPSSISPKDLLRAAGDDVAVTSFIQKRTPTYYKHLCRKDWEKKNKNQILSDKAQNKSIFFFQRSKSYQKQMNRTESNCLYGEKRSHLCGFISRVTPPYLSSLCCALVQSDVRNTQLSLIQYIN